MQAYCRILLPDFGEHSLIEFWLDSEFLFDFKVLFESGYEVDSAG